MPGQPIFKQIYTNIPNFDNVLQDSLFYLILNQKLKVILSYPAILQIGINLRIAFTLVIAVSF